MSSLCRRSLQKLALLVDSSIASKDTGGIASKHTSRWERWATVSHAFQNLNGYNILCGRDAVICASSPTFVHPARHWPCMRLCVNCRPKESAVESPQLEGSLHGSVSACEMEPYRMGHVIQHELNRLRLGGLLQVMQVQEGVLWRSLLGDKGHACRPPGRTGVGLLNVY